MRGSPAQGRALSGWRGRLAVLALAVLALPLLADPAVADGPCVPDAATGCVEGSIRSSAGQPLAGVAIAVAGPAGSVSTTTGADGTWSAPVTADGKYTVTATSDWVITWEGAGQTGTILLNGLTRTTAISVGEAQVLVQ